jgi:hypothetical protein
MRDHMDDRHWVADYNELGLLMGRGVARVKHGLSRFASWDGTTPQLFAIVAAFLITSLGFTSTTIA